MIVVKGTGEWLEGCQPSHRNFEIFLLRNQQNRTEHAEHECCCLCIQQPR